MKTHKDLDVWKMTIELAKDVYEQTKNYPKEELYGLVSQMRRCAVSIASNISEGAARQGKKEFIQFLYIALGSASELDTQIEISKSTGNGDITKLDVVQRNIESIKKMLSGLIRSLKRN